MTIPILMKNLKAVDMTLLDYFAGQALSRVLADVDADDEQGALEAAVRAYDIAEKMLAIRAARTLSPEALRAEKARRGSRPND